MKSCVSCGTSFDTTGWTCPGCGFQPQEVRGHILFAPEKAYGDGTDAEYRYDALAAAEARHFWFRARGALIAWAFQNYFPGAGRFLEVGCGTGYVLSCLRRIPGLKLLGSDVRIDGLDYVRSRVPGVETLQMDVSRMPFSAEFDVLGAFDVIEHLVEDEAALRQFHQSLRPGGGLLLTVPQHRWLWSAIDEVACHKRRYTRAHLVEKVQRAGFEVLRSTSFVSTLLPLLWLSRQLVRRDASRVDPRPELRIVPVVNEVLLRVLGLERSLIRMGLSLPAGGSLLLVARKPDVTHA